MKKKIKVLAFISLSETPITHILEVFTPMHPYYDIEIIIPSSSKSNVLVSKEVKIREVPFTNSKIPGLSMFIYEIYTLLYLLISRENISMIYNRERVIGFVPYVLFKLKKIPVISEVNGILSEEVPMLLKTPSFLNPLLMHIMSCIQKKIFLISDKIIAVTPKIKNQIKNQFQISEVKLEVIENGANIPLFHPMDKKEALKKLNMEKCNYIGFVGSIYPWQGLEFLIQCAPLVLKEVPNTKFIIVGDGPDKNKIVESVKKLNLDEKFIFTGMVPYPNVPLYMNASDVCIVYKRPLKSGYSPLKLYEYMACGKPVIASRVLGFEILEEKSAGVLVEPLSTEKLANAIIELLKDEKLREKMGINGREFVKENHSWSVVSEKIKDMIQSMT